MYRVIITAALLWAACAPAHADFDAGMAAASTGDFAAARAEWQPLAEAGDAATQYHMGLLNAEGRGGKQNFDEAGRYFHLAAAQGHADAQFAIALMIDRGQGVPQDDTLASQWYLTAAENDHVEAQYNLAIAYMRGSGVAIDEAEGVKWFKAAGEQGYSHALVNLGVVHAIGKGVERDPVIAYMWFRIAIEKARPRCRPSHSIEPGASCRTRQIAAAEARAAGVAGEPSLTAKLNLVRV